MLVPVAFVLALLLTLGTALLESSVWTAKMQLQSVAARYSDAAITDAVADFTAGLARFVEQHGSTGPWPRDVSRSYPRSLCAADVARDQCPFSSVVSAAITAASTDSVARSAVAQTAPNLQTAAIDEGRVSVRITATITSRDGTPMGTRTRWLTYRVFAAPPYAVVAGVRDAAAADGSAAEGDDGGEAPARGDTAAGDDTRIHVQLTCASAASARTTLPANDGLPWGKHNGGAHEMPCRLPASSADAFADGRWRNGNDNASGWNR